MCKIDPGNSNDCKPHKEGDFIAKAKEIFTQKNIGDFIDRIFHGHFLKKILPEKVLDEKPETILCVGCSGSVGEKKCDLCHGKLQEVDLKFRPRFELYV